MKRRQQGMSIVVALFVVTVVASLAAFAVTVGGAGQQNDLTNVQASRALAAARSGLEWGAYRVRGAAGSCVASRTLNLTEGALRGFQVVVTCTPSPTHTEGAAMYRSYDITARASYGTYGSTDFAYRALTGRYFDPGF